MILTLDYGDRYIGLALTDTDLRLALRHSVIDQKQENALKKITELVGLENIKKILVGLPVSLSKQETNQTSATRQFIAKLAKALPKDIELIEVDETFTSKEADRRIREEGGKKEQAHAEAARLILESWLKKSKLQSPNDNSSPNARI